MGLLDYFLKNHLRGFFSLKLKLFFLIPNIFREIEILRRKQILVNGPDLSQKESKGAISGPFPRIFFSRKIAIFLKLFGIKKKSLSFKEVAEKLTILRVFGL